MIWAEQALTPQGWKADTRVTVSGDGTIASVTPGSPPDGTRVWTLLPAPANLHSHAFQRAMAGMAERRSPGGTEDFWTWRELMFRFLRRLTPEDVHATAAIAQMEMLEAGFAAVGEFHYLHHQPDGTPYGDVAELCGRIADAAAETGIGLTLLPTLYQHAGCGRKPLAGGQLRFGNDPGRFADLWHAAREKVGRLPADARIGVAAHSLRAVDTDGIAMLGEIAPGVPAHMHLAEQQREVDETLAVLGARPIEWALDHIGIDARWCLVHATQATDAEVDALARSGAVVGLCPITESNLGDGIFPCGRHADAGGRLGIGSDSNVRISLTEELRTLEYSQRLRDRRRGVLARPGQSVGRALIGHACAGGAQATGRKGGAISPGLLADLVSLDRDDPALADTGGDGTLDAWVFASGAHPVDSVWSAGRQVVAGGRHVRRDRIEASHRPALSALRKAGHA